MRSTENKALVHRYLDEIINKGRFEVAEEIMAPDYINHTAGGGIGTGRADYVRGLMALRVAFPDWHMTVQEMINEGDIVSDRLVVTATHTGQASGAPPDGVPMTGEVMHMWRLTDSKLVEGWYLGTPSLMLKLFAALTPP
jgi:predicted ester cyclase